MWKQKNRLYSNPANFKSHEKGATVTLVQPFKFNDKKVMLEAIDRPENLFLQFSKKSELQASRLLSRISVKIQWTTNDLPIISEWDEKVDFLHNAFSTIVYAYCWVETYVNEYIEKYSVNIWAKRYSLQEKIWLILDTQGQLYISKANKNIWNSFVELENMRDQIIHSKYSYYNTSSTQWSELLISKVYNWKFKKKTDVWIYIIKYIDKNKPKIAHHDQATNAKINGRWLQSEPI